MSVATEVLRESHCSQESAAVAEPEGPTEPPVTLIESRPSWRAIDLGELWRYRELLMFLIWRDVKVRYKQTILGASWAVLQPLATMVVFSLFFSKLAAGAPLSVPYPLFVLAGLIPWTFFANAVTTASQSIVGNQNLVTKVYFPRLIIPMATVGACLVDLAIAFGLLLVAMLCYGVAIGSAIALLPLVLLGLIAAALGVGTLLAALTVAYRDFRHAVPFLVQLGMFATPAIFLPTDATANPRWHWLLALNPAHGLIAGFRTTVLGTPSDLTGLLISGAVGLALLFLGGVYFRRVERGFADII